MERSGLGIFQFEKEKVAGIHLKKALENYSVFVKKQSQNNQIFYYAGSQRYYKTCLCKF